MEILIFRSTRLFIFQYQLEFLKRRYPKANWTVISNSDQHREAKDEQEFKSLFSYNSIMFSEKSLDSQDIECLKEIDFNLIVIPFTGNNPGRYSNISKFCENLKSDRLVFLNEHLQSSQENKSGTRKLLDKIDHTWRKFLQFITSGSGKCVIVPSEVDNAHKLLMIGMEGLPTPPVLEGAIPRVTISVCEEQSKYTHYIVSPFHLGALAEANSLRSGFVFVKKNLLSRIIHRIRNSKLTRKIMFDLLDPKTMDEDKWKTYLKSATQSISEIKPDTVVIQNMPAMVEQVRSILPDSTIVLFMHNQYFMFLNDRQRQTIDKNVRGVITISQQLAKETRQYFPNKNIKIEVVRNGIDLDHFTPAPATEKIPCKRKRILFASRVHPSKGLYQLIKAFQLLMKEMGDVDLAVAGISYHSLWRPLKGYEAFVTELIQESSGRIIPLGYVENDKMLAELRNSDLFVLSSTFLQEGMPSAILEAQACGVPVIGSFEGGIPEIIDDGKSGFMVNPTDHSDLCDKMKQLLENNKLSSELSEEALLRIKMYNSKEIMASLYQKAMDSILN